MLAATSRPELSVPFESSHFAARRADHEHEHDEGGAWYVSPTLAGTTGWF
jgi:hypothetical protein